MCKGSSGGNFKFHQKTTLESMVKTLCKIATDRPIRRIITLSGRKCIEILWYWLPSKLSAKFLPILGKRILDPHTDWCCKNRSELMIFSRGGSFLDEGGKIAREARNFLPPAYDFYGSECMHFGKIIDISVNFFFIATSSFFCICLEISFNSWKLIFSMFHTC